MTATLTSPVTGTTLLLFGPQVLSFQEESFNYLKARFDSTSHDWALQVIAELPRWWDALAHEFPLVKIVPGQKLLTNLVEWSRTGSLSWLSTPLQNIVLTPLVVLTQLIQYECYLSNRKYGKNASPHGYPLQNAEVIGFCTGLLSASAIASSATKEEFQQHASRAVRLAMFIGAFVDAQDASLEESKSFSVAWTSPESRKKFTEILETFSKAYISVFYDERRVTVTCSTTQAPGLLQQLRLAGLIVAEIGLRGRFHSREAYDKLEPLIAFCDSHAGLRLPYASQSTLPAWLNRETESLRQSSLHSIAIRAILGDTCDWYATFSAAQNARLKDQNSIVLSFGSEKCVPPTLMRKLGPQFVHVADLDVATLRLPENKLEISKAIQDPMPDAVAVVGMSIKVAGADDLEEFWSLLSRGRSQHIEVPEERFGFETPYRDVDTKRKWYGNFVRDHDAFDHKFFRKSPREMSSTDPQQRLILQAAYQAVQQSGYFRMPQDKHIGCYIGVGLVDYERNISCHPANAFSATGNLKSFAAGKISHYFGWTGPSLTIDTACSSSAVAVHSACMAILQGECSAAIAGGTNVMSSPEWFQNLAGASFLSPTGQCKPFDAKSDGYCRGEGVGAVFLKSMAQAIHDGDQILGVIASSAVYQNENSTAITVPNAQSLQALLTDVTRKAHLQPHQVTYVEAHGTGTPVGDPAECEGIRRVFGGPHRSDTLSLGSVKGLVGHTEAASGIVALVKTLLMVHEGSIPPQASFVTLNPSIASLTKDHMEITTSLKPWATEFRAAVIQNYGASGSNASLLVTETMQQAQKRKLPRLRTLENATIPIWLSANDDRSLQSYSKMLQQFLQAKKLARQEIELQNLAFNIARQSNHTLARSLVFTTTSVEDLQHKLSSFEAGCDVTSLTTIDHRPTILCFGGQVSTYVGLSRRLYDNVYLLRHHLDQCNATCESLGIAGIYPEVFQRSAIEDTVKLQMALFAVQYSCAMCWIECDVQPVALVGHSFGELTALCVSGILSLDDAIKMIASRAKLVRDAWGPEKGSMIALDGDLSAIREIIEKTSVSCDDGHAPVIACYNSPRSFTVAGSVKSIDQLEDTIAKSSKYTSGIRTKRLNVSNAFHSTLVNSIMADLEKCGAEIVFGKPNIHLERASETAAPTDGLTPRWIAEHMRYPVFFNHAVQRLTERYPSAIWLEAGSRSTITTMASRAQGRTNSGSHFQAVDITSDNSYDLLAETTASLWKQGLNVTFWAHHKLQLADYKPLLLPPYQFEKAKHWLQLKKPPQATPVLTTQLQTPEQAPERQFSFAGYQDKKERHAKFYINTKFKEFKNYVAGHMIAQATTICPSTLQLEIVIEALMSIHPDYAKSNFYPQLQGLDNHAPMFDDDSRITWLDVESTDSGKYDWDWKIISHTEQNSANPTLHASGRIIFRSVEDSQFQNEFLRYERLMKHNHCRSLLDRNDIDDVIHGRHIYKTFSEIVDFGKAFQYLQRIVGKDNQSAGRVRKQLASETWLDTGLWDSFCQVAGIYVNCMTNNDPSKDIYISNKIEQWIRSPKLRLGSTRPETCDILALHHRQSDRQYLSDVFVFDSETGELLDMILGISYNRVSKASLARTLLSLAPGNKSVDRPMPAPRLPEAPKYVPSSAPVTRSKKPKYPAPPKKDTQPDISDKVLALVANVAGLELHEISNDTPFEETGIDSLMRMELAREIESVFKCTFETTQLSDVVDVNSLAVCIKAALRPQVAKYDDSSDNDDRTQSDSDGGSNDSTPLSTGATSDANIDVCEYFAELLGVEASEISMDAQLKDLCVDSLAGSEVWTDLTTKFQIDLPADATMLELKVRDIETIVNGMSKPLLVDPRQSAALPLASIQLPTADSIMPPGQFALQLPAKAILEAFNESKQLTDDFIVNNHFGEYMNTVLPKQTELCIVLTLEAWAKLGCDLYQAKEGDVFERIPHLPQHKRFVDYLYNMLDKAGNLIHWDGNQAIRTATSTSRIPPQVLLDELLRDWPEHVADHKLTYHCGIKLAECLSGTVDGIQLIFGSAEGRELVSYLYANSPVNKVWLKQQEDFLSRLVAKLPNDQGPLRIMEMGGGTGGATKGLVPLLASLDVPIEYTFSDISASLVAAARKRFKQYSFMSFRVHDIEKETAEDLLSSQHIVISNNCVHATHDLTKSTENIRSVLRPDGFLMMMEMTTTLYWVDVGFGPLEGWWLFQDGREHAVAHQSFWERKLKAAGYGYIDWTEGHRPESNIQRNIIALASQSRSERISLSSEDCSGTAADCGARQREVEKYVLQYSNGFTKPCRGLSKLIAGSCVLITGATGSLGCHLVEHFANQPEVRSVVCMNRRNATEASVRQKEALESRGIRLATQVYSKLRVIETDITKPRLGLSHATYSELASELTDIVHNAWPMSITRSIKAFEAQMQAMRNLIDLAQESAAVHPMHVKIGFQFISSIATVGYYPLHSGHVVAPEERMEVKSVLPSGYGDAKLVCEHMLDQTLHKHPDTFRAMVVRIGQIAGSRTSGYWNPVEHFSMMMKSSQTLNALPDLRGSLSWCPVNDVAATLGDLLLLGRESYSIYHIENPARQPWEEMIHMLADALQIPNTNVVPFEDWLRLVRDFKGDIEKDNPAAKLVDFIDEHFLRMSCGGLMLGTERSREHSATLANAKTVDRETVRRYVTVWKAMGFLTS